jgi:hypothetical protein
VHSADRLILSVTLASDLQWSCPLRVKLELSDGSVVELDVDPRSTRSGNLQGAQTLRLWLKLPSQLSADPSLVDMGTLHLRITK